MLGNREGGIPRVQVADGVGAEFGWRMAISDDLLAKEGFAGFPAPGLRIAEEELLVRSKPRHGGCGGLRGGATKRIECDGKAREVGDVLAQCLTTINRKLRKRMIVVVLAYQRGASSLEFLLRRPESPTSIQGVHYPISRMTSCPSNGALRAGQSRRRTRS